MGQKFSVWREPTALSYTSRADAVHSMCTLLREETTPFRESRYSQSRHRYYTTRLDSEEPLERYYLRSRKLEFLTGEVAWECYLERVIHTTKVDH